MQLAVRLFTGLCGQHQRIHRTVVFLQGGKGRGEGKAGIVFILERQGQLGPVHAERLHGLLRNRQRHAVIGDDRVGIGFRVGGRNGQFLRGGCLSCARVRTNAAVGHSPAGALSAPASAGTLTSTVGRRFFGGLGLLAGSGSLRGRCGRGLSRRFRGRRCFRRVSRRLRHPDIHRVRRRHP